MSGPIVIGYRHTGIITNNMEGSLKFYRDLLGLEVIQDFWDDSDYINTITGIKGANVHMKKLKAQDGTVVELLEYVTHPTDIIQQPIYNVGACHLAFHVNNVEDAYERIFRAGIHLISRPVVSSEGIAKVCFCIDPNNIRVELVEMIG